VGFIKGIAGFMWGRKKLWLFPAVLMLLIFGTLFVFSQGSAVVPFIDTLI